jgi:ubiquinol-cytochrome c reductase cytochrome b subunit
VQGAMLFQARNCAACHLANGVGMKIGPPLNGLAKRRTKEWVAQHFVNPQALSPGSIMPPYQFSSKEMDSIVNYLFTLPD